VPYIGTWCDPKDRPTPNQFKTGYKNFIYLSSNNKKIKDLDPKRHPEAFGHGLFK